MTITNLRRCLAESNLESAAVAASVGISDTLMSQFVCGHRPIRPIYHLLNLAGALNRRPSELLGVSELDRP
jgi:transcriptional regulator with XRE-family HTH domain